jgi:hypothetical protein
VFDLNQMARTVRHQQGELGMEQSFSTFRGERNFAINDRIYFLKNDRNLGVMNGSLGTITNINPKALTIELDNTKKEVVVDFDLYNHIDYGYAATIHKSQGVTVDRGYLLASKYLDAHATYVGMTRHRESVDLFYSKEEFPKYNDLVKILSRDRAKDISLDYTENNFAVNYGIHVPEESARQQEYTVVKESFPFRSKFSNLQEFTVLDAQDNRAQDFNILRAELAKQVAGKTQKELEQTLFSNGDLTTQVNKPEELARPSRDHELFKDFNIAQQVLKKYELDEAELEWTKEGLLLNSQQIYQDMLNWHSFIKYIPTFAQQTKLLEKAILILRPNSCPNGLRKK